MTNVNKTVVIGLIMVAALAMAGWWFLGQTTTDNKATDTPANTNQTNQNPSVDPGTGGVTDEATITYTNSGFSPRTLEVKAGTKITIVNNSSATLEFASDPHPIHTNDPELNIGFISPGAKKELTLTSAGTYRYHDHLNAVFGGTIVVR